MIKAGEKAQGFSLKDQSGQVIALDDLLAKGDLILYFYPADFTPVCTAEACTFRDNYDDLQGLDVQVIGISPQGTSSHARFARQFELPFPILSDPRKKAIRAYGVNGPFGVGVRRATFLIGQDGTVRKRVVADLSVRSHSQMIRQVIEGAG